MSDEFESINSRIPDIQAALVQRIIAKTAGQSGNTSPGTVDPYQLMLAKNRGETLPIKQDEIVQWPAEDVQKLTDFCQKNGILGFNCGKMHPLAALSMLKQQVGDYSEVPLEERIPAGYERRGTHSGHSANYPYTDAIHKKQILHG